MIMMMLTKMMMIVLFHLVAAGDNSTDNTGPFQDALNAAQQAGGGDVYAPPGLYLFLGSISIPSAVTLQVRMHL